MGVTAARGSWFSINKNTKNGQRGSAVPTKTNTNTKTNPIKIKAADFHPPLLPHRLCLKHRPHIYNNYTQ